MNREEKHYRCILGRYGGELYLLVSSHPVNDPGTKFEGSFMSWKQKQENNNQCNVN